MYQRNDDAALRASLEQLERTKAVQDRILEDGTPSFCYGTLTLVAVAIAGLELVTNSVATMLVSPPMGPVVGMAYGTTTRDWTMA